MRTGWGTAAALGAVAALALACSHPRPPGAAEFEPYAEAEAAKAPNPHSFRGKPLCQRCHVRGDGLRGDPVALCRPCHASHGGNHPVDVAMAGDSHGLPLWRGRVTCASCHDPHDVTTRKAGLRRLGDDLCLRCHPGH